MFKLIALAGTALVVATPALAQNAPADQATSVQKPKDPNRVICEKDEETGSRLGSTRVCKTAAQWDALRHANREQVEDWQRQLTSPGKPAG